MLKEERSLKEMKWHAQSVDDVMTKLQAEITGLSAFEATIRLRKYGQNRLPKTVKQSAWIRFFRQFHNILIYILLGAAVITILLHHRMDALVILAVVFVNAIIGFIQEGKAEKALDAIRHLLAPTATVLRDGKRQSIDGHLLVPGDIVLVEAGDKVPADLRLLKTHGLIIDEAILTGESIPVEKYNKPVRKDVVLGDRVCMAYNGTFVINGQGKGVVVATGKMTQIGQISSLLSQVETLTTPLIKQMELFSKWLTLLILLVAALLLTYGYFVQHYEFSELFMIVVGLSVAAIPEGLPAVLSITLAVGVQVMARKNAIVRHLPVIETLGSISVICTDKTGTLTRNEMAVISLVTSRHVFTISGAGYIPSGLITLKEHVIENSSYPLLKELARTAILCNDAALFESNGHWIVNGDPMEGALLTLAGKIGVSIAEERKIWARTDMIPFDSRHHFMATLHHNYQGEAFIFVKGAPERILSMCRQQQTDDGGFEAVDIEYWRQQIEAIAAKGQRVLAFALKPVKLEQMILKFSEVQELTLLGMTGMIDPPREEVIVAVAHCLNAGIQVKMITGDHAATAKAIGQQIGLRYSDKILTGVDLDKMSDSELAGIVLEYDIYARTSPEHKLRLVMALQSHGMIVAMTGDGVNDALALRRADVGIAMGKKGNEVSKEASEFVLADDNFASIVAAIQEGRTVYDNLKKVISWTLPTNAGEAMVIILALLLDVSLPVTPIQILWLNLITATTLGLALAFEPPEKNTMQRPPRPRNEPILTGELAWHIIFVSMLFIGGVFGIYYYALDRGYSLTLARTIALNTLVVMEIFHLFYIRNIYGTSLTWKAVQGTTMVWLSIIVIIVAQFSITYWLPLQTIFMTGSVPVLDGILIILVGVVFFSILEIEKQLRLHLISLRHMELCNRHGDEL
ncbi:cation-transporting P-type ATPase [Legionella oakridgensis]|uniref:ATPase, P-type transporting, HAD superfamily, subfamily IC n=2 Tax=Legionella oakridgensis TaxID=29423 RepID=W0BE82_9GAMM|nr:cation-transporting P-type ATPase [Legionella oakridgensis]AHE66932.1 ATPase, P-type transporting, HAD superfamily, subfamily IC [Legionella oakridgensis ATCC 33761 = DSM 21215]KTD39500.1 cation efflux transporter [Legionella oakridgensis]STY20038.1 cation transport ATPase [Legionella longbeachae]